MGRSRQRAAGTWQSWHVSIGQRNVTLHRGDAVELRGARRPRRGVVTGVWTWLRLTLLLAAPVCNGTHADLAREQLALGKASKRALHRAVVGHLGDAGAVVATEVRASPPPSRLHAPLR